MNARGNIDFVGHVNIPIQDLTPTTPVNNVIINAATERGAWIEQSTKSIGEWRATCRSTYMRWAIAINGLFVADSKYSGAEWQTPEKRFRISSIRTDKSGFAKDSTIAEWDGATAAKNHRDTQPMLVAYGLIDVFACIEKWVFAIYRLFLNHHPHLLLRGNQYKELRRLQRQSKLDTTVVSEWNKKWKERLDSWHMKRAYDGLDQVFMAYFNDAKLKRPAAYSATDVSTWAKTVRLIAIVRNLLIHGEEVANDELETLCGPHPHAIGFDFRSGDQLLLSLRHLQAVECFLDQLLNAVNMSLIEHADAGK